MASSLMTDLCAWSSQPQQTTTKRSPKYHAHFDCFSGAAGDMMLAACLDAADSLPANSLQLSSNSSGNNNINDANTKNSEKLLSQIVHDLEEGLPELKGEFELSMARVWRGMGRIAAIKVDVKSVYNHEAAPVPGANIVDDEVHVDNVPDGHSSHEHTHEHEHKHEHAHQHNHDHNDIIAEKTKSDNSHSHSHSHDSSEKDHAVSQPNNVKKSPDDLKQQEGLKEDPLPHDHAHNHGHEHKHNHSHGHNHSHNHDHDHSHSGNHDHHSHSNLRNLPQITQMLQTAPPSHIPRHIASLAVEAFTALAHAEMHTHGAESIDRVHFHEVGAVDSIVDTVGTLLGLYYLGVDLGDGNNGDEANGKKLAVSCSRLPLGEGTVWTDHGLLPVPAPATMRLMIGMATCPGPMGVTGELVTPTAAALLRVLTGVNNQESKKTGENASGDTVGSYWQPKELTGRPPCWTPRAVGLGAGSKDFERHPNVLRLILGDGLDQQKYHDATNEPSASPDKVDSGEAQKKSEDKSQKDGRSLEGKSNDLFYTSDVLKEHDRSTPTSDGNKTIVNQRNASVEPNLQLWDIHTLTHLEANIDDATPELLAHAIDLLLKNGAIDAWVHPIVMKKGRPANALHCICRSGASSKTNTNVTSSDALSDNESEENRLLGIMFRHTTTLGIRIHRNIIRAALKRRFVEVQLPYLDNVRDGKVDVKISSLKDGEVVSVKAEFDQCKVISEESNIPLKIVSSKAERLAWDEIGYQV